MSAKISAGRRLLTIAGGLRDALKEMLVLELLPLCWVPPNRHFCCTAVRTAVRNSCGARGCIKRFPMKWVSAGITSREKSGPATTTAHPTPVYT